MPEILRKTFDLPGINISGEGTLEDWQATARHDLMLAQTSIVDASGIINRLD